MAYTQRQNPSIQWLVEDNIVTTNTFVSTDIETTRYDDVVSCFSSIEYMFEYIFCQYRRLILLLECCLRVITTTELIGDSVCFCLFDLFV